MENKEGNEPIDSTDDGTPRNAFRQVTKAAQKEFTSVTIYPNGEAKTFNPQTPEGRKGLFEALLKIKKHTKPPKVRRDPQ